MPDQKDVQKTNDDQSATQATRSTTQTISMFSANSHIGHPVLITGISGDRTPDETLVLINDPGLLTAGHTYSISFTDPLSKFESVVA